MNVCMARALHWCFTLNNYSEDEYTKIEQVCKDQGKYYIVGKEVGDGGTPHLQGFISFRRRFSLQSVRSKLGSRIHAEVARGSPRQNREYCRKDGDFIEGGDIPADRKSKVDRDVVARQFAGAVARGHDGIHEFSGEHPAAWYFSGHNLLRNALALSKPIDRPNIYVQWIYGEPGVGKSKEAHTILPSAYIKEPKSKWWNGYLLEKTCIIDDFGPQCIDINHLLRWFDRYKCLVETKGGMVPLHVEHFIVTSNFEPSDVWRDKDGVPHPQMEALYRRIDLIKME